MSGWTDELRQEVIDKYLASDPTPENSMDIVTELADEFEKTPNGVRLILTKAGVYVKKTPGKKEGGAAKKEGSTRVSKQEQLDALTAKIEELGGEVNDEILSKMTGKAAQYFLNVLNTVG